MDTFSQLSQQHRDEEAALREERRRKANKIVNEFCDENEWSEDERQEILLALGVAEPHTQG
jgi:hypothetical protein